MTARIFIEGRRRAVEDSLGGAAGSASPPNLRRIGPQLKPDGKTRHPMRIAETRCTWATCSPAARRLKRRLMLVPWDGFTSSSHTDAAGSARELAALAAQVADLEIRHVPSDTAKSDICQQKPAFGGDGEVRGFRGVPLDGEPMEITDKHTGRAMPVARTSFLSRRRLARAIDMPAGGDGSPSGLFFSSPSSTR
jgi:hypothetical protein